MLNTTRIAIPVLLAAAVGLGASATAQDTPGKPVKGVPIPTTPAGAAPAAAPAAPDTIDPKAKAIHDKGMDTLRKLKNVDMVSEMSVTGVDPSMLPPGLGDKTRFVVDFEGAGGMMPFGRLAAERATDGKTSERFATDGKSALMVDEGKKSYMQGGPELMGAMGPRASTVQWLAMNRMMDPAAAEGQVAAMLGGIEAMGLLSPATKADILAKTSRAPSWAEANGVTVDVFAVAAARAGAQAVMLLGWQNNGPAAGGGVEEQANLRFTDGTELGVIFKLPMANNAALRTAALNQWLSNNDNLLS